MRVISEMRLVDFKPWCGAKSTWERIINENKEQWFEDIIEDLYPDGLTDTNLNDILWFESEWLYESLEIDPDED